MSGSDRMLAVTVVKRRSWKQPAMSKVNAGDLQRIDRAAARDIEMTRSMAISALGSDAVLTAERLRGKGWSVRSIAKHLRKPAAVIAALFGVIGDAA